MSWTVNADGSLTGIRGDDARIPLEFLADDEVTPIDLTGFTVRSQVRTKPSGYVLFEFEVTYTDRTLGQVLLTADHDVTKGIIKTAGWWDVELTHPSGFVETILGPAEVEIIRDVTLEATP